jgi:hypothetical protein
MLVADVGDAGVRSDVESNGEDGFGKEREQGFEDTETLKLRCGEWCCDHP